MQSKYHIRYLGSTFCSYQIYQGDNKLGFGPDYVRLKMRYEVSNGVSKLGFVDYNTRRLSYLSMIGATQETIKLIADEEMPITLTPYYEQIYLI